MSSKREEYIISMGVDEIFAKKISLFGEKINSHKYNVWIAKEFKNNPQILERENDLMLIIDWAKNEKPDLFQYSFEEAFKEQEKWHENFLNSNNVQPFNIVGIDNQRAIFRASDQKHFFYLLKSEDLDYEGEQMSHCVGTYKERVKNFLTIIISLRDEKNRPHMTLEINPKTRELIQVRGKGNSEPLPKYKKFLTEFALYASGYQKIKDKEILDLINLNFV